MLLNISRYLAFIRHSWIIHWLAINTTRSQARNYGKDYLERRISSTFVEQVVAVWSEKCCNVPLFSCTRRYTTTGFSLYQNKVADKSGRVAWKLLPSTRACVELVAPRAPFLRSSSVGVSGRYVVKNPLLVDLWGSLSLQLTHGWVLVWVILCLKYLLKVYLPS